MKRVFALVTVLVLAVGASFAQSEAKEYRFEVSAEKGLPSVLSGPQIKDISNKVARVGFSPSHNFQLTLTYTKWDGLLARNDILNERFSEKINSNRSPPTNHVQGSRELWPTRRT